VKLLAFEERWAAAVLEGFAPPAGAGESDLAPMPGEVDYVAAARVLMKHTNLKAALGMRAAVWMVALSPIWSKNRERKTLADLDPPARAKVLERLLGHDSFAVRELTLFLKVVSCMAIFGVPALRERAHYDLERADLQRDQLEQENEYVDEAQSGERPKFRLGVLRKSA
jgi:hypothetical protein